MQILLAYNQAEGEAYRNQHPVELRGVQIIDLDTDTTKIDGARLSKVWVTPAAVAHHNFAPAWYACVRTMSQGGGVKIAPALQSVR